jgi:hypothetical protein
VRSGSGRGGWSRGRKQSAASSSSRATASAWAASSASAVPRRVDDHVVDEHHPLAPVVERGQLADHRQHGVGMALVVGGRAGQVLDLPDHVVAQVADQAGMERGQVGEVGRLERLEDGLQGRQDAAVPLTPCPVIGVEVEVPSVVTVVPRAVMVARGLRPTNEYRPQRSPPSTDSRRKPVRSPASTIWRKAPTGVMVSATSSRHTGTMRCLAANAAEAGQARAPEGPAGSEPMARSWRLTGRSPKAR